MTYTLYLGDCLDYMRGMDTGSVDAVITDPPYGISFRPDYSTRQLGRLAASRDYNNIVGDDNPFDPAPFLDFRFVVLFGYQFFASRLPPGNIFIWDKRFKNGSAFLGDAELIWCKSQYKKYGGHSGGYGAYIYSQTWQGFVRSEPAEHPTQKPIGLMMWCIEKARIPAGATIFDPYMGSGTTGIAALLLGYNFIGCEIDPAYYAIAERRIKDAAAQPALFTLDAPAPKYEQGALMEI